MGCATVLALYIYFLHHLCYLFHGALLDVFSAVLGGPFLSAHISDENTEAQKVWVTSSNSDRQNANLPLPATQTCALSSVSALLAGLIQGHHQDMACGCRTSAILSTSPLHTVPDPAGPGHLPILQGLSVVVALTP